MHRGTACVDFLFLLTVSGTPPGVLLLLLFFFLEIDVVSCVYVCT